MPLLEDNHRSSRSSPVGPEEELDATHCSSIYVRWRAAQHSEIRSIDANDVDDVGDDGAEDDGDGAVENSDAGGAETTDVAILR